MAPPLGLGEIYVSLTGAAGLDGQQRSGGEAGPGLDGATAGTFTTADGGGGGGGGFPLSGTGGASGKGGGGGGAGDSWVVSPRDGITVLSDLVPPWFPGHSASQPYAKLFARSGTATVYYPIRTNLKFDSRELTMIEGTNRSVTAETSVHDTWTRPMAGKLEWLKNGETIAD